MSAANAQVPIVVRVHCNNPPFFTFGTWYAKVSALTTLDRLLVYLFTALIAVVHLVEKGSPDWVISVVSPVTLEVDIKVVHGNQLTQSQSFAVNRSGESDNPSWIYRDFPV